MSDNALHLMSERGSPIVLFSIFKACRISNESQIVWPQMSGSIVKRVCGLSEISVPRNVRIDCKKGMTNMHIANIHWNHNFWDTYCKLLISCEGPSQIIF
jgi:hypothetical protein